MSLPPVYGHEAIRRRLGESARDGRLPASLLFYGPEGVGKQRTALWLASLLQCAEERACGECRSCRLARRLEHPDIHWFFPLSRPKGGGSREKLREKLEEARMEALEEIREDPVRPRRDEGATGIYLAAVQEIRGKASRRPAMGPRTVFVVGDAERMVPQAANPEAANAFLKVLEEPPPHCHLLLTSSRPDALLPTVRSRVLGVRLAPLSEETVERFLLEEAGADPEEARHAAAVSRGSIGRALRLLTEEEQEVRDRAAELLTLAVRGSREARLRQAAHFPPAGARGEMGRLLDALDELLRDLTAAATGEADRAFDPDLAGDPLDGTCPHPDALVRATDEVQEARELADGNVNPQAIVSVLLSRLARLLEGDGRDAG